MDTQPLNKLVASSQIVDKNRSQMQRNSQCFSFNILLFSEII